jgi:hypothetical protein
MVTANFMINGLNSSGLIKGDLSSRSISAVAWSLFFVGYIEKKPTLFHVGAGTNDMDVYSTGTGMLVDGGANLAPLSFEETYGKVEFVGWHFDKAINNKWNVLLGSNTFYNKSAKHAFDNQLRPRDESCFSGTSG